MLRRRAASRQPASSLCTGCFSCTCASVGKNRLSTLTIGFLTPWLAKGSDADGNEPVISHQLLKTFGTRLLIFSCGADRTAPREPAADVVSSFIRSVVAACSRSLIKNYLIVAEGSGGILLGPVRELKTSCFLKMLRSWENLHSYISLGIYVLASLKQSVICAHITNLTIVLSFNREIFF